ncbi:MAG TPA: aspartate-semialdehyde dehydrogenase [Candidatus Omnitrophota bacterium]|nr:aspartate-semialdehyde dehydrogenase [Candidatus Omnitrophota bacterium]
MNKVMKKFNVAVVGVGAVGEEMLRVLRQRQFPVNELKVFARSSRTITVDGQSYQVEQLTEDSFKGLDIVLFAGTEGEKGAAVTYAARAIEAGAVVIDNGADFRLDPAVPLVVPEANAADIKKHKGVIANPNCSTIQMVVALSPIHKKVGIKRIIVSTYQAVSGSGRGGIVQAEAEFKAWANNDKTEILRTMDQSIAFNIFPHIGSFTDDGYTTEEMKMVHETHKILHDKNIKISATTVRVPVKIGHSEAVYIETKKPITPEAVRSLLRKSPGITVLDDPKNKIYPMPRDCEGKDDVFIGRIRRDPAVKNGLWLWIVADNVRKGAALNAVQIAEELVGK